MMRMIPMADAVVVVLTTCVDVSDQGCAVEDFEIHVRRRPEQCSLRGLRTSLFCECI